MTSVAALRDLVEDKLRTVSGLNVFVGWVESAPNDPDGKTHPYAVLWVGVGMDDITQESLTGAAGSRNWTFRVTAAGGDPTRALWAAERTLGAILGFRPATGAGQIRLAVNPDVAQIDRGITPPRWFFPLEFTVEIP